MVGRPKQFECEQALEQAMEVFWTHGYEATSVQDLLDGMGINRGSMYDTFGDKHALFVQVIDHYDRTILRQLTDTLDAAGSPLGNIRKLFSRLADRQTGSQCRGCLICNTAVELAPHDAEIAKAVKSLLNGIEKAFYRALQRAVEVGELAPTAKPRALARFLTNTLQGMVVMGKVNVGRATINDIVNVALSVLE